MGSLVAPRDASFLFRSRHGSVRGWVTALPQIFRGFARPLETERHVTLCGVHALQLVCGSDAS